MIEFLDTSRKTAFAINEMHINPVEYFDFNFMISINYSFYILQKSGHLAYHSKDRRTLFLL